MSSPDLSGELTLFGLSSPAVHLYADRTPKKLASSLSGNPSDGLERPKSASFSTARSCLSITLSTSRKISVRELKGMFLNLVDKREGVW